MSEILSAFNPLKILHYSPSILELINDSTIPNPAMVSFDFSNPCSHFCKWCSWTEHREKEGGFLDEEVFKNIVLDAYLLGVRGWEICGGGEPLLNPMAHEFIQLLGKSGDVLLITNGSHLTVEDAKASKTIRVSLDAANSRTHKKLHGTTDFGKIINNISDAAPHTRLGIGFLIHPDNYKEIPALAELALDVGCDFAHIRPCFTDYDGVRDKVGFDWFNWIKWNHTEVRALISKAKEYETEDFKVYATLGKTKPKDAWKFDKCYAPYFNPMITPSGGVWICCERRGVAGSLIGTVPEDGSFREIWFGEKHKQLMRGLPNELCPSKCKFLNMNEAIDAAYISKTLDLNWI